MDKMNGRSKKKDAFSIMAGDFVDKILGCSVEVIDAIQQEKEKFDDDGHATGEIEQFIKFSVEISRGFGELSRLRFDVKVPDGKIKFDIERLEEEQLFIKFNGLEVSFVDARRNVYFRACDYEISEEAVV